MSKRVLGVAVLLYLAAAISGRVRESRGELRCDCLPGCWCKKPGLSLFRWVFPFGHSLPE